MQQLSVMVLLHVESRLNSLHSCFDLLAASFFATATLLPLEVAESVSEKSFQSMCSSSGLFIHYDEGCCI